MYNKIPIMSLYSTISNLDLSNLKDKISMYSSVKLISNYIRGDVSKFNKSQLNEIIGGLKKYLLKKSELNTRNWIFNSTEINLDKEQYSIVSSPLLETQRIIAGAGSGKTTTVLCRVKYLLDNFVCPDRILILTFNRDAAQNMRNRIDGLFGFPICLQIYTIDAFCCKIMNTYSQPNLNANNSIQTNSVSEYSSIGLKIMKLYGKELSAQFTHVFFDEFQDVNDEQFNILKIFSDCGSKLIVIGDDCQNIYQFRGTNNYYMVNFDIIFPHSHTYKLTTNYRSTKEIVNMANESIEYNHNRVEKIMNACEIKNTYDIKIQPQLVITETEELKYKYIIKKIKEFVKDSEYNWGSIAILSRNTHPLKCMERVLTEHSIPHVALITDTNSDDNKRLIEPNKIALTTIHKSKGLEFDLVIIIGLSHQHFPEHLNNNIKNIEEERRLFYVGITRSKGHLLFCASIKETPLSIFLKEVQQHLVLKYYKCEKKYSRKQIFNSTDTESNIKTIFGVNELISSLQSNDYKNLRESGLIPNYQLDTQIIFPNKLTWEESIKKGAFEADFGEFVDRYLVRSIIIGIGEDFFDVDTEFIIEQDKEDKEDKEDNKQNQQIIGKMISHMQNQKFIRTFRYPTNVINEIKKSYINAQNSTKSTESIESSIYWISLCRNFRLDRARLAYRNIYNLFVKGLEMKLSTKLDEQIEYDSIKSRIEYYITKYTTIKSDIKPQPKISLEHKFYNIAKKPCVILGELDIIIWDSELSMWVLTDFKCSECEFKLEWVIQLLTYYSMGKLTNKFVKTIGKLRIVNIMDGKEYTIDIDPLYPCEKLIKYFEHKIELEQQSIRPKPDLTQYIGSDSICNNIGSIITNDFKTNIIQMNMIKKLETKIESNFDTNMYTIIFDTETTDFVGDIIQIAWVLMDSTNKIIKRSNKYIKNRLPSYNSMQIHKITPEKLRNCGEEFEDVIKEFIEDLIISNKIVGHNISYDLRMVINNLRKFGIQIIDKNKIITNIFETHEIICTRTMSKGLSLENLHMKLFNKTIEGAHDAMCDVEATTRCYIKLNE